MCFTKYFRNFILCGNADYYCLLCDELFHKLDDVEKHIRWEKHRKVIKSQTVLPKFKNDGIFKIESFYFCQHCNHISGSIASIKDHIGSEKHAFNKTNEYTHDRTIASYESGSVVINKIKIESNQWQGIQNNMCLFCDQKVGHILKHTQTVGHIVRLIQSVTKYESDNMCYRRINESTYQCFICMKTFPAENFDQHWEDHRNLPKSQINGNSDQLKRIYNREEYNKLGDVAYDVANLVNIKDEFFDINIKTKEITCKQCKLAVQNTKNSLANHMMSKHSNYTTIKSVIIEQMTKEIDEHYVFIYEKDAGKLRHELSVYGKENYIKLNAGGSKGYCLLCDRFLSSHMNIFKQHVEGKLHTGHLEIKGLIKARKHKKGTYRTETFNRHLTKLTYLADWDSVVVNFEFCIDSDSFLLIKRIKHGRHFKITKCFVCEETFKWWQEKAHCETEKHKNFVMAAKVVIEKNNFIREIKPKLYHCGLCNVTLPNWDTLETHIEDMTHKTNVMSKHFATAMSQCQKGEKLLPERKKISLSSNIDIVYTNIMKVLFQYRCSGIKMFSINLDKLKQSNSKGIVTIT